MFNPTVLALCVLTNENRVDIRVGSFVPCDRTTGTHIGEEGECAAES
jgi:hypothetical protein